MDSQPVDYTAVANIVEKSQSYPQADMDSQA